MFPIEKIKCKEPEKEIYDFLKQIGYKEKANGSFARVCMRRGSDLVYKVGKVESNAPYLAWVKVLSKAEPTKYEPKIHSLTYYGKTHFVVCMEKLKSYEDAHNDGDTFVDQLDRYFTYGRKYKFPAGLKVAIARLRKARLKGRGKRWGWDFHVFNIMLRGKQPVIIDPLFDRDYM